MTCGFCKRTLITLGYGTLFSVHVSAGSGQCQNLKGQSNVLYLPSILILLDLIFPFCSLFLSLNQRYVGYIPLIQTLQSISVILRVP